jgi:hypothetical protein
MGYIKIKELPLAIIDKSKMDFIENKEYKINYEDRNFFFKQVKKNRK